MKRNKNKTKFPTNTIATLALQHPTNLTSYLFERHIPQKKHNTKTAPLIRLIHSTIAFNSLHVPRNLSNNGKSNCIHRNRNTYRRGPWKKTYITLKNNTITRWQQKWEWKIIFTQQTTRTTTIEGWQAGRQYASLRNNGATATVLCILCRDEWSNRHDRNVGTFLKVVQMASGPPRSRRNPIGIIALLLVHLKRPKWRRKFLCGWKGTEEESWI